MKKVKFSKLLMGLILFSGLIFLGCQTSVGDSSNNENNSSGTSSGGTDSGGSGSSTAGTESSVSSEITTFNSSDEIDIYSWSNSYTANKSSRNIISGDSAYSEISFAKTIYIKLDDFSVSEDNSSFTAVSLDSSNKTTVFENISAYCSDNVLYIDSSNLSDNLKFDITGTAQTGAINISSNKKSVIGIYLHDATISSSGNYPCINVDKKSTVYLELEGTNNFTDGRSYGIGYSEAEGTDYYTSSYTGTTDDGLDLTKKWAKGADTKGSIYAKGPLLIGGSGSLTLIEGYKHGIYSKDYIRVFGGTLNISTSGRNAIQSVNGFIMDDGSITISGTGTNTNNESRAIVVEGEEGTPGEGFIVINGGEITSTTVGKAISAKWDIDEDSKTTDTTDDPYPYVWIKGGKLNIKTTGTPMDESSSKYSVLSADGVTEEETTKRSPEGIEGKQAVFISGGVLTLNCTDDCINSSRDTNGYKANILISGGNIYAYSSNNDSIDSNGDLTIKGGIVVALTSTTPECAFDCDENTFAIKGGLVAGIGTNNYSKPTDSSCSQSTVVLSGTYFGSSGTTFAIEDSNGSSVFAFKIPEIFKNSSNQNVMILSSPNIKTGTTYKAVSAVSTSDGKMFNNLYVDLPTVSGGSATVSDILTTTSSYVYTKNSGSNGGAQEGAHTNPGPGGNGGRF